MKLKFFCCLLSLLFLFKTFGQPVRSKWTNKDKGTVIIGYTHIGIFPEETKDQIRKEVLIGIVVRCYELTESGRKPLKKNIRINNISYKTSDTEIFDESDTSQTKAGFFSIWLTEGEYSLSISGDNDFYPVRSDKYFLTKGSTYSFDFYLVRKNALQKVKQ